MFLDGLLKLSEDHALSGAGGLSQNVVDLGNTTPRRDIGTGEAIDVIVSVDVTAAAGGTYVLEVLQSDLDTMASPDVIASRTVLAANMTAGALIAVGVPPNAVTKRYLAARFTLGGTTPTVTLSAYVEPHDMVASVPRHYADNITIK